MQAKLLAITAMLVLSAAATAQPTALTYQGRLKTEFFLSASTARIVMVTGGAFTDSDWSLIVVGPR